MRSPYVLQQSFIEMEWDVEISRGGVVMMIIVPLQGDDTDSITVGGREHGDDTDSITVGRRGKVMMIIVPLWGEGSRVMILIVLL